jgi:hypothetical protein
MSATQEAEWGFAGAGIMAGLVLAGGVMYAARTGSLDMGDSSFMKYFNIFVNFLPSALLWMGIPADLIISGRFKYSLPSIVALGTIGLSAIGTRFLAGKIGVGSLSDVNNESGMWCTIPGLEFAESPILPQAFVVLGLIGTYYLSWQAKTGTSTLPLGSVFGVMLIIQLSTFALSGHCPNFYIPLGNILVNIIAALAVGAIVGAITFGFTLLSGDEYNPFINNPTTGAAQTNTPSASGAPGAGQQNKNCPPGQAWAGTRCHPIVGTSGAVQDGGDENTFVAELYKNGQLVTEQIAK